MSDQPPADAPVRSFKLRRTAQQPDVTVPFDLDGKVYHLHPRVNGLVMVDLASLTSLRVGEDSKPMWEFFEGCMGDEYPEFRRHVRASDVDIEASEFKDLVMWMVEQVTQHPTGPSSS